METKTQEITYRQLDSDDKEIDAMWFIAQMFERLNLTYSERARVSKYFFDRYHFEISTQ
jgi:hypothetical protein